MQRPVWKWMRGIEAASARHNEWAELDAAERSSNLSVSVSAATRRRRLCLKEYRVNESGFQAGSRFS
jgi:hypothetical protein